MYKKILITTDFSRHSYYALERAMQFAATNNAELSCIYVLNHEHFKLFHAQEEHTAIANQIHEAELTHAEELKKLSIQYPVAFHVLNGRAPDKIIEYISQNAIDLVFMGAHGTYYLHDYILGTNSKSVLKQTKIPVQLVKKEPNFSYQRILIALDFSQTSKKVIETAYKAYPDAEFLLLHVADVWYGKADETSMHDPQLHHEMNHALQEKITEFLASCDVDHSRFSSKFIGGYPADDIAEYALVWGAHLVVIGTRGHSLLHYILMGRVTDRLLRINATDMLVVPS